MAVLVTGFEPFDGAMENPSWEAVRLLPEKVNGLEIKKLQLPVVYGKAASMMIEEIGRLQPDVVICCGVAGGRKSVTPELVALNYRMAKIADNDGYFHSGDEICPDGPVAYRTQLPVQEMISAMNKVGIPAQLSLTAGAYVCNDLYYHLLQKQDEMGYKGLFVHVPNEDVVNRTQAAQALQICIETILK